MYFVVKKAAAWDIRQFSDRRSVGYPFLEIALLKRGIFKVLEINDDGRIDGMFIYILGEFPVFQDGCPDIPSKAILVSHVKAESFRYQKTGAETESEKIIR